MLTASSIVPPPTTAAVVAKPAMVVAPGATSRLIHPAEDISLVTFILVFLLYLPMYNAHSFLTNFASKIKMHIIHGTFLFSYEVICITTQKVQSRTNLNFMQPVEINHDKRFV